MEDDAFWTSNQRSMDEETGLDSGHSRRLD